MARNKQEMKYYGVHACDALFRNRASDIIRVYLTQERVKTYASLLKWCAKQKKAYHIVTEAELEKIAQSVHHEGITILGKAPDTLDQEEALSLLKQQKSPVAVYFFDGVQNPHNIGSVVRTAAHFGIPLIVGAEGKLPPPNPSMYRIAQGACELVQFATLKDPLGFFKEAKTLGYYTASSSSHSGNSLYTTELPEKIIFILGNEVEGVSAKIEKAAELHLKIPGTEAVESLNVSVSAALFGAEFWRQQHDS